MACMPATTAARRSRLSPPSVGCRPRSAMNSTAAAAPAMPSWHWVPVSKRYGGSSSCVLNQRRHKAGENTLNADGRCLEKLTIPSTQAAISWEYVAGGAYRTQRFRMRRKRSSRWSRRPEPLAELVEVGPQVRGADATEDVESPAREVGG